MSGTVNSAVKVGTTLVDGTASVVWGSPVNIPFLFMAKTVQWGSAPTQAFRLFGFAPLFALVGIVFVVVRIAAYVIGIPLQKVFSNVGKCFRQYVRKKNATPGSGVIYGIQRPLVWFINLIESIWSIFTTFFSVWFIVFFILTITIGTILLLAELHQNELIQFIDIVLEILRRAYNGSGAFGNLVIEVVSVVGAPMWNAIWSFLMEGLIILMDYLLPLIYSEERTVQFTAGGGGGRRQLLKYAEYSFTAPFRDWVLKPFFSIYFLILKIFFDFALILWRVVCWLIFAGPLGTSLKFVFELISGWPCLLKPEWIGCSFRQILQLSIDMMLAFVNMILGFINFLGMSINVPRSWIPDVECKSAPGGITAEECSRCTGVFTGFKQDCKNRGTRILFTCDFNEDVWTETIIDQFYNEFKVLHSHSDATEGCHHTNQLLYGDHLEVLHKVRNLNDCISLRVNGTIYLQFCPEQIHRRQLQYHYHHHHLSSNHTGRRLSSLSDIFNNQRKVMVRKKKGIESLIPVKVINRTMYNKIYTETRKSNPESSSLIYNCTNEPQRGEVFDSLCALQTMATNSKLKEKIAEMTQSVQSVKMYHAHEKGIKTDGVRRQLDQIMYAIQSGAHLGSVRRRRQLKSTLQVYANGSCPTGYERCLGTSSCEIPDSCSCPNVTMALNPYETVSTSMKYFYCDIKNFDLVGFVNEQSQCWREYRTSNAYSAIDIIVDAGDQAFNRKFKYCFPLIDPESPIRWPEIAPFTFQDMFANTTACTRGSDDYGKCLCPGFPINIYAYDVYVSEHYGLFVEERILVTIEIAHITFGAFINTITLGYMNYWWQSLLGWDVLQMPYEAVHFFDTDLSLSRLMCIVLHLGSPMIVFLYAMIYVMLFVHLWRDFTIISMDIAYGLLYIVYKLPLFKKKAYLIKPLSELV